MRNTLIVSITLFIFYLNPVFAQKKMVDNNIFPFSGFMPFNQLNRVNTIIPQNLNSGNGDQFNTDKGTLIVNKNNIVTNIFVLPFNKNNREYQKSEVYISLEIPKDINLLKESDIEKAYQRIRSADSTVKTKINDIISYYAAQAYNMQVIDPVNSINYIRKILTIQRENYYPPQDIAWAYSIYAFILSKNNLPNNAKIYLDSSLYLLKQVPDSIWSFNTLDYISSTYYYLDNKNKVIEYDSISLILKQKYLVETDVSIAFSLEKIAYNKTFDNNNDYTNAINLYTNAISIREINKNSFENQLASDYNNLGVCYERIKQYDKAIEFYKKAFKKYSEAERIDSSSMAQSAYNIANALYHFKNITRYETISYLYKSIDLLSHDNLSKDELLLKNYYLIGWLHYLNNNIDSAEHYIQKGINYCNNNLGFYNPTNSWLYSGLALIYERQNRNIEALNCNKYALKIREKVFGIDNINTIQSLYNAGYSYAQLNLLDTSSSLIDSALHKIYLLDSNYSNIPYWIQQFAFNKLFQNKLDESKKYFLMSIDIFNEKEIDNHRFLQLSYLNLGYTYYLLNEYDSSIYYFNKFYSVNSESNVSYSNQLILYNQCLGDIYSDRNRYNSAIYYYEDYLRLIESDTNRYEEISNLLIQLIKCYKEIKNFDRLIELCNKQISNYSIIYDNSISAYIELFLLCFNGNTVNTCLELYNDYIHKYTLVNSDIVSSFGMYLASIGKVKYYYTVEEISSNIDSIQYYLIKSQNVINNIKDTLPQIYSVFKGLSFYFMGMLNELDLEQFNASIYYYSKSYEYINSIGIFKETILGKLILDTNYIKKNNLQILLGIANSYFALDKPDSALMYYQKFLKINSTLPENSISGTAEVYKNIAFILSNKKQTELAINYLDTCIAILEQSINEYSNYYLSSIFETRGNYYQELNQYSSAISDYSLALELNPIQDNSEILWRRALCYYRTKDYDKGKIDRDSFLFMCYRVGMLPNNLKSCNLYLEDFDNQIINIFIENREFALAYNKIYESELLYGDKYSYYWACYYAQKKDVEKVLIYLQKLTTTQPNFFLKELLKNEKLLNPIKKESKYVKFVKALN